MAYALKLELVWLMLFPVFMLLVVVPNCVHDPEELDHHVAVMVCVSGSVQTVYSVGVVCMFMVLLVGASLLCVGIWLVVKL